MSENGHSNEKLSCFGAFIPLTQSSSSEASEAESEKGMCLF